MPTRLNMEQQKEERDLGPWQCCQAIELTNPVDDLTSTYLAMLGNKKA